MTDGTVEAVTEHLRLRKYFDVESAAHPLVRFFISLYTTVPTRLSLLDALPEGITADEIAFHPNYYGECWSVGAEYLEFECSLDWDETIETAYAVALSEEEIASFLVAPTVRLTDPTGTAFHSIDPDAFEITGRDTDANERATQGLTAAFDAPEPLDTDDPLETEPTAHNPAPSSSSPNESTDLADEAIDVSGSHVDFIFDHD